MTASSHHHSRPVVWFVVLRCVCVFSLVLAPLLVAEVPVSGRQIYVSLCAECHGREGEGVAGKYAAPLGGNRSYDRLLRIIETGMPEDDPELCVGEEAEAVARYVFEAYYSASRAEPVAEARVELVRLTNRQYTHAVADLLGGGGAGISGVLGSEGLMAAYHKGRGFRRDSRVAQRVDAQVDFDFGEGAPDVEGLEPVEFAIQWRGSLRAIETGEYEFTVRTPNGVRLWVNDTDEPLIDAWLASGDLEEHGATVRLLEGRAYPFRVDFFKSKDKRASVVVEWTPPHGVREVIPARFLWSESVPPTFVVTTRFPPDDASVGYERGALVSPAWEEATTHAAIEAADHVSRHLDALVRVGDGAGGRAERVRRFCREFVETAFRRPLSPDQERFFVEDHFEMVPSLEAAVRRVVVLVLKSPRFLYLGLDGADPDAYDVAARLSFGLWDSLPDRELLDLASEGQLVRPEVVRAQARRMLDDPRARAKVRSFLHHWLQLNHADNLAKDAALFPEFTPRLVADLRTSLDLFLDEVVWSESADYRGLLLADFLFVNEGLATFYGVPGPDGAGWLKAAAGSQQRAGVLTHPYLLALFAYPRNTSPIHRGVFLTRNIVGRALKPPPVAVAFADAEFDPALTMREKVEALTRPEACQGCHATINPLGFSLEHYDAVGRFRTVEGDRPVQAVSDYLTADGEHVRLTNAQDLARHAAANRAAHEAFIERLFHQVVKQPVRAYGPDTMERLSTVFAASEFNVQRLLVEVASLSALHRIQPPASDAPGSPAPAAVRSESIPYANLNLLNP
jgi:hypothetical protein